MKKETTMKISTTITNVKPNFRTNVQYGSKADKFDMMRVRPIAKKFGLKCRFSGGSIFIGSQLETISRETFVSLYGQLDWIGFVNNNWETLLDNAEKGILNGFSVHGSI